MQHSGCVVFEIDGWRVDSLAHTLTSDSGEHQVPAKVMAVLVHLAHNQERLVTRQELIDVVWGGNAHVGNKSLNNAIWRIRQVFGDDTENAQIIRTTPKTGYQLIPAPVFIENGGGGAPKPERTGASVRYGLLVGLAVAVAAIVLLQRLGALQKQAEAPLVVVTQMSGRELYPSPSPDGTAFAFLHVSPEGADDIYIQSLLEPDEPPVRISPHDADNHAPTWAPDSRHLAYMRIDTGAGSCEIMLWDSVTEETESIGICVDLYFPTLSWSPDGRWLVYRKLDAEFGQGLYLKAMNPEFRPTAELEDRRISCEDCSLIDHEVSWSPDSKTLAITRSENRMSENVYKFDLDTFQFGRLTSGEISIKGHTWHKDGRRLLYVSNKHPNNRRLWTVDTVTRKKQELGYEGAGFPVYLPDYESILLYKRRVTTFIASTPIDQPDEALRFPRTVIQANGAERNPAYSSAVDKLAYYSNLSGHNEIWIADPDGSNRQRITDLKTNAVDPSWSDDGQKIAFVALDTNSGSTNVKIYDLASQTTSTVLTGFGSHGPPTWSRDGQSLIIPIWEGRDVDLWRVAADGNQLARLTTSGGKFGRESPDGTSLYFTKAHERGLFRISYADGEEQRLFRNIISRGRGNWTWAGPDSIIYARYGRGHSEIARFDLASGTQKVLIKHPRRIVHRSGMLSYSASRGVLYFTHREPQQIDIKKAPDPLKDLNSRR